MTAADVTHPPPVSRTSIEEGGYSGGVASSSSSSPASSSSPPVVASTPQEKAKITPTPLSATTKCICPLPPPSDDNSPTPPPIPQYLLTTGETLAGAIGGSAGIIIGHPFDTLKVRMQRGDFRNSIHCLKEALHQEGSTSLFRGLAAPVIGNIPLNSIIFGVYGTACTKLADAFPFEVRLQHEDVEGGTSKQRRLQQPLWQIFLAGTFTGIAAVPVQSITDLVKIRMQLSVRSMVCHNPPSYHHPREFPTSTWGCLRAIFRQNGVVGLSRGMSATALRDTWSHGVSFGCYEAICRQFVNDGGTTHPVALIAAGGAASAISWGLCYPIDVIKSAIQAEEGRKPQLGETWRVGKELYKDHGWKSFTRGLGPSLLRALPVGATTFGVYEGFLALWHKGCTSMLAKDRG